MPSLLRGFSAPVKAVFGYTDAQLAHLLAHDSEPFARWEAGQELMTRILLKERPEVVVTTGAAPGLVALALARRLGSRTVWIDSIANVERLSTSGEHARRVADVWLTQWEHLARPEGPHFWGAVL